MKGEWIKLSQTDQMEPWLLLQSTDEDGKRDLS